MKRRIESLVGEGRRKLVLNMAAVSYMDSTCLGEIVGGLVTVKKQGGLLRLANLTPHVERLVTTAGLTSVLLPCDSEDEAVRLVAAGPYES